MSLIEYLRILRRRGWIILLAALLTAASALVFSVAQTPVYKSTAYILVQPARTDFGLTSAAKTLLRSYVSWMNTRSNAQKVIDELKLDRTAESLLGDVTIASDDSRFVIQVDVESEDGDQANRIALKWAELFVQWRKDENQKVRREDHVEAMILDLPQYVLDRPQTRINLLAGAILGGLLGGMIVFVLEYVEAGVIRSSRDVERALNLPVLGAVPAAETGAPGRARRLWGAG
jgi:capsular polysaccharide biosynthesis protein